jgi:pyruvate carboxylase
MAAEKLVAALKQEVGIPIHFHTHDTSGLNAASVLSASDAGVDIVDLAIASMSGSTSQPNLNSVSSALAKTERDPGLDFDSLNEFSDYWEEVLGFYKPFDSAPRAGTAEVYEHEMPGGQYTNLREQANAMGLGHRWREIARTYAEVNQLFGDIVKVTPSSKVVGDMCMFLVTRGIKASDVPNLKPGSIDFPESVIDMLSGGLGQPDGGWPADVQKVVLGPNKKATVKRPGELGLISIAYKIPPATHPDSPALTVLSDLLADGLRCRFYLELTDAGLTTDVIAYPELTRDPSLFLITAELAGDNQFSGGQRRERADRPVDAEVE